MGDGRPVRKPFKGIHEQAETQAQRIQQVACPHEPSSSVTGG